jgi:hypothetical protein
VLAIAVGLAAAGSIVAFAVRALPGAPRVAPGNEQRVLAFAVVALLTGAWLVSGLAVDWPEWASGVVSALAVALVLLAVGVFGLLTRRHWLSLVLAGHCIGNALTLTTAGAAGPPRRVVRAAVPGLEPRARRGPASRSPARRAQARARPRGSTRSRNSRIGAMICPRCQSANPDEHRYCSQCGVRLLEPSSVLAGSLREQLHRGLRPPGRGRVGARARAVQALPRARSQARRLGALPRTG